MTADDQSTPEEDRPYTSPGALLRQARESANLSQRDIVAETRMTLLKVRALEEDDFASLQSDTFVRGYLRIYAKMLNLDPETLLAAYRQSRVAAGLEAESEESPLQINVSPPGRPLWHFAVWIVLVLMVVSALSVWFFGNRSELVSVTSFEDVSEVGLVASATTEAADPEEVIEISGEKQATPSPLEEDAVEQVEVSAQAIPEVTQMALAVSETQNLDQLQLNFTDECWLVVTDARGDVLLTDLVQPGENLNLRGQAPFEVKMGNASAVQLSLNGEAVDLQIPSGTRLMTAAVGE